MKRFVLCLLLMAASLARADSGVIIPRDKQAPDSAILSLEEMTVHIVVDNGDAHISVIEVFANHTKEIQEGTYRFALPDGGTVSDFAVWDGPVRIPAVILETKRAETVYEQVRAQALDPGLLEMGDSSDENHAQAAIFNARIAPIPPYGTKRVELDFHQRLPVTDGLQSFTLPLKPDAGQGTVAAHFHLFFELHSAHPVTGFSAPSKVFPLKLVQNDPQGISGSFEADKLALSDDFQASWTLDPAAADRLEILVHRDPKTPLPTPGETAPAKPLPPEPGFFEAQMLIADPKAAASAAPPVPRTVVLLLDDSLSMQWDKLERSYAALEAVLHALTPADRVNILLFNQDVTPFAPEPAPATPETVAKALAFVRAAHLRGGTDLGKALQAGLAQAAKANGAQATLVLLTDGHSDRGATVLPGKIAAAYNTAWHAAPHGPRTDVLAVGDDADLTLLGALARHDGFLEQILSTEPADLKLGSFVSKLTHSPVAGLMLTPSDPARTRLIYPLDDTVFPGMLAQWVGQYQPAPGSLTLTAHGERDAAVLEAKASTPLPAAELAHPQLPRLWAQARVDALLAQIDRDGETAAAIEEIIQLSRRYKFVTPYTSFLAVPRSLLRPRVIRPGDPVLRVRTDPAIASVVALFPFGLTKPLRHIGSEDAPAGRPDPNRLWETRFLAPPEMKDGTYAVRLLLRDVHGNLYREAKTFVIASTPPTVRVELPHNRLHRGESIVLRASASASTRNLTAHLEGLPPVPLRWSPAAHANTGLLTVPAGLAIGRYTLTVTAEDVAHNLGTQEVEVDVLP